MVQQVTIPLSWANQIPGVSGIQDVTFSVPELSDIEDTVDRLTLDAADLLDEVTDPLQDQLDQVLAAIPDLDQIDDIVVQELDQALGDFDDRVIQAVEDVLADLDDGAINQPIADFDSVFGALREDVVQGFEEALDNLVGTIEDLPEEIDSLAQGLNRVIEDLDELSVPTVQEFQDAAEEAVRDILDDVPGGDLLLAPAEFIDAQVDRLADDLVSDEIEQTLEDSPLTDPPD